MSDAFSREQLHAYLDDALSESEMASVEKALRESADWREALNRAREERDRGEHSLGGIWRQHRISCPSREELNSFLHGILDDEPAAYIEFHLTTIGCPTCLANRDDLKEKQAETTGAPRRRRILDSSQKLLAKPHESGG